MFCWYWWNCWPPLFKLSFIIYMARSSTKKNSSFYFDLEKNMVAIDHSCFWLAEALIISSETKIPNNLLVDTENFDFVWIWQKHDTMRNSCFWLEEIKRSSALHLQRIFFLSEYYCLLKKLSDKTTFPNDLLHSTHDVYEVLYKDSSTSLSKTWGIGNFLP